LVAVFAHFVADERTRSGASDRACGTPENCISGHAADHGTYARADLRIAGVGSAATHRKGCSAGGCKKDVTDFHGKCPYRVVGNQT
jgi:hypothetical protein